MKKTIALFSLLLVFSTNVIAQQVQINNNLTCDIVVTINVWDLPCTTPTFGSNPAYGNYTIQGGQFLTFAGGAMTQEYEVFITVDPNNINYTLPVVYAIGNCGPTQVDSGPNVACTPDEVEAVSSGGPTNWVIDVNPI